MKKYQRYITSLFVASTALLGACSDDYMTRLNTDPTKPSTMEVNAQLTTAELGTYGDLGLVEIYRNYIYGFTQQLMGNWNTTNYGGRHTLDNDQMSRIWTNVYTNGIKNISDALERSKDDNQRNIHAALSIYRVYLMSIITDTYGDVPYSESGKGFSQSISTPRYDRQQEIYYDFFNQLDEACKALSTNGDKITGDVIYNGDITKWKKLANSLRLRFAMRISDVDAVKAQSEFEKALSADGGIIDDASADALIKYMPIAFSFGQESYKDYRGNALSKLLFGNDPANNPSYVCSTYFDLMRNSGDPRTFMMARCYYDELMSATSTEGRIDLTDEVLAKNITLLPCKPGAFSWEPWPTGYTSDILAELSQTNPKVSATVNREIEPKLANNFLKGNNPGVVITSAEVKLLLAEAKLKGWNVSGTVSELYKAGVREAIDFVSVQYGYERITDADFDKYIAANGIGYTAEKAKEAINTQAWILHFTNPAECWANLRRSGYPRLKSPVDYGFGQFVTGGSEIPVRLCYPVLESSYNKVNYDDALARMGGTDDWHTPVWWDIN